MYCVVTSCSYALAFFSADALEKVFLYFHMRLFPWSGSITFIVILAKNFLGKRISYFKFVSYTHDVFIREIFIRK